MATKAQVLAAVRTKFAEVERVIDLGWPAPVVPPVEPPVETPPPPTPGNDPAVGYDFMDSFETSFTEDGKYAVHSGNSVDGFDIVSRLSAYTPGRHGARAVRLTTMGKDFNHNSGSAERCDLSLNVAKTGAVRGAKQWWAHSCLLPDNWVAVPNYSQAEGAYQSLLAWHWDGSTGQGNVNVQIKNVHRTPTINDTPHLHIHVYGGVTPGVSGRKDAAILGGELPKKNIWYDFLWYIEWGSAAGRVVCWCRRDPDTVYKKQFDHNGPTLFRRSDTADYGSYLKLGNYHAGNAGRESSVVHDRVARGPTMASVALFPIDVPANP